MKKLYSFILMATLVALGASAKVEVYVQTATGTSPYMWTWGGDQEFKSGEEWPTDAVPVTEKKKTSDGKEWFHKSFDTEMLSFLFLGHDLELAIQSSNFEGVTVCGYYIFDDEMGECEDVTKNYYDRPDYDTSKIPAEVKFLEGETFAYFVKPAAWATPINAWVWDANNGNEQLSGVASWPGASVGSKIGTDKDGLDVFLWKLDQSKFPGRVPTHIIFNSGTGSPQSPDFEFTNGGYYGLTGLLTTITKESGIASVKVNDATTDNNVYSIDGRLVNRNAELNGLAKGIYIVNGKKVLVK